MEIFNQSVSTNDLPSIEDLQTEPLSQKYRPVHIATTFIMAAVFLSIMTLTRFQSLVVLEAGLLELYQPALAIVAIVTLVICTYHFFADPCKRYALREHDLHFQSGLFFRAVVSQPILRIQHVEIKRGPIERMFNLASLQVFSAGGATHTFEIPGLDLESAQNIRQYLLAHKDIQHDG